MQSFDATAGSSSIDAHDLALFKDSERPIWESLQTGSAKARTVRPPSGSDRLLVTGGTGFIGGAVLAELIGTDAWKYVLIMVRAADVAEGRRRIIRSIQRFMPGIPLRDRISDDQIIIAGLEDSAALELEPRIRNVTHVINSAAVTSFSKQPRIRAINVDASLKFVEMLKARASVRRFINVGTAWCVGMDVENLVREDEHLQSDAHVVPYTASKLEFERSVRELHPDFPFVSARPSIVVGHTRYGTAPSGSIYWVFRSVQILGRYTCEFDGKIDVVPVDWVASSLVSLSLKEQLSHSVYHLSAGRASFSTIGQLDSAIARGRNVNPHGRAGFKCIAGRDLKKAVYDQRAAFGDANPFLLSRALGIYAKFAESGVLFDNARTLSEGVESPPPFHSYADVCARTAEQSSLAAQMEDDFK